MKKSEILFLYETSYNIPNGDPFTGEQRYDEETKKILVSDVRIKRFVRTYLEDIKGLPIYVSDKTGSGKNDAKGVLEWIAKNRNPKKETNVENLLKEQIDVRLFGGVSTLKDADTKKNGLTNPHVNLTGAVQFKNLNPSLNKVNLRIHQNTSHFTSSDSNKQGAIATTTIVPYSLMQIHGWINPTVAEGVTLKDDKGEKKVGGTGLTDGDLKLLYEALWYGTSGEGSSFSRSKIGQDSILLAVVEYVDEKSKVYGLDRLITITPKDNKKEEQIRSWDDYTLNLTNLLNLADNPKVAEIKYYTELDEIDDQFKGKSKFVKLSL